MMATAKTLLRLGVRDRDLYLFDTYEGMSAPSEHDVLYTGLRAQDLLDKESDWCYASIEDVKDNLVSTGYPEHRMHFIKGKVEDTLPANAPAEIALLRLDTDFYESTLHELITLYPNLVSGGVLILDDYGEWQGVKRACEDYFVGNGVSLLLNRIDFSARVAIKP